MLLWLLLLLWAVNCFSSLSQRLRGLCWCACKVVSDLVPTWLHTLLFCSCFLFGTHVTNLLRPSKQIFEFSVSCFPSVLLLVLDYGSFIDLFFLLHWIFKSLFNFKCLFLFFEHLLFFQSHLVLGSWKQCDIVVKSLVSALSPPWSETWSVTF